MGKKTNLDHQLSVDHKVVVGICILLLSQDAESLWFATFASPTSVRILKVMKRLVRVSLVESARGRLLDSCHVQPESKPYHC